MLLCMHCGAGLVSCTCVKNWRLQALNHLIETVVVQHESCRMRNSSPLAGIPVFSTVAVAPVPLTLGRACLVPRSLVFYFSFCADNIWNGRMINVNQSHSGM